MVLDAQVHHHVVPRLAARGALHHEHRSRLAATDVAARLLGRLERLHETLGEVALRALVRRLHGGPDFRVRHEVRLAGELVALHITRVGDARRAGKRGDGALGVHHRDLPTLVVRVGGEQ